MEAALLSTATPEKDPLAVELGRRGAAKRWAEHEPRTVRLDELTAEQRRLVVALIDAAKKGTAADHGDAPGEVRDAARTPTS